MKNKTYDSVYKFLGKDLQEEAQYLEARIEQMGFEGDCAYERAMYTFYLDRLSAVRLQMNRV
jgi:hypothetical protein